MINNANHSTIMREAMLNIQGLDHIVLRTCHIDQMQTFYCDVLGCQVERVNKEVGLVHLRAGAHLIDLLHVDYPSIGKNLEHFCLRIQSFDYALLQKHFHDHGIETLRYGNRYSGLGHGFSFYVSDPDGNEIEFIAAPE